MPGQYEDIGGDPPQYTTLLTVLDGAGPPLEVPDTAGFQQIAMGQQVGGQVGGGAPGFWTGSRSDCVVIAAMQRNAQGAWVSYYFTHLNGGLWTATEQALFNQVITDPQNTFVAMNSNAFSGMATLLEDMNAGNPSGAIPLANLLEYKSPADTFALRLSDAAIGQVP
jgi:hypothetical protein